MSRWNWVSLAVLVLTIVAIIVMMLWILRGAGVDDAFDAEVDLPADVGETVHAEVPRGWLEDAFAHAMVSADGGSMLRVDSLGVRLVDLLSGADLHDRLLGDLGQVMGARFDGNDRLARFGNRRRDLGWFLESGDELRWTTIPSDAAPAWAPGNDGVIWARPPGTTVSLGEPPDHRSLSVPGKVLGLAWSPRGDAAYVLTMSGEGSASLIRVGPMSGELEIVRADLDASALPNGLAVSTDGNTVFVALASAEAPDPETRHDSSAGRDLDIYAIDVRSGAMRIVIAGPDDDFWPWVAGDQLYWTNNEWSTSVLLVPMSPTAATRSIPVAGAVNGEPDAQRPSWSPDGRRLAFTRGGWRLADWGLNLDAFVVAVGDDGAPQGAAEPLVAGYHEDRTPTWSADGRWLAYRSRRSTAPVPYYAGPGVADDVFVRRAEATTGEEIRLTDFGWEVGSPDWAPDGRHVVFDTWDRTGVPRVSRPWVAGFDPDSGSLIDVGPLVLPDHIGGSVSALWSPTSDELLLIERADPETQILWVASLGGEGAPAFSAGPDLRGGSDLSGGVVLSRADKIVEFRAPTESGADWTPDGSHIVYSAVDEGRLQLFAVPAKGGEPRRLSDEAANLLHPSVSPDGRWVAVTRLEQRKTVRRLPLSEIR